MRVSLGRLIAVLAALTLGLLGPLACVIDCALHAARHPHHSDAPAAHAQHAAGPASPAHGRQPHAGHANAPAPPGHDHRICGEHELGAAPESLGAKALYELGSAPPPAAATALLALGRVLLRVPWPHPSRGPAPPTPPPRLALS